MGVVSCLTFLGSNNHWYSINWHKLQAPVAHACTSSLFQVLQLVVAKHLCRCKLGTGDSSRSGASEDTVESPHEATQTDANIDSRLVLRPLCPTTSRFLCPLALTQVPEVCGGLFIG